MDLFNWLPKSLEKDLIMVIVDKLSKHAYFIHVFHTYTTTTAAKVFIKGI